MSQLTEFADFCGRMGGKGLRSISVSLELSRRLRADAQALGSIVAIDPALSSGDFTIAGVEVVVEDEPMPLRRLSPEEMRHFQREKNRMMTDVMDRVSGMADKLP